MVSTAIYPGLLGNVRVCRWLNVIPFRVPEAVRCLFDGQCSSSISDDLQEPVYRCGRPMQRQLLYSMPSLICAERAGSSSEGCLSVGCIHPFFNPRHGACWSRHVQLVREFLCHSHSAADTVRYFLALLVWADSYPALAAANSLTAAVLPVEGVPRWSCVAGALFRGVRFKRIT